MQVQTRIENENKRYHTKDETRYVTCGIIDVENPCHRPMGA